MLKHTGILISDKPTLALMSSMDGNDMMERCNVFTLRPTEYFHRVLANILVFHCIWHLTIEVGSMNLEGH